MTITVKTYEEADFQEWDEFCADSLQSSFLHSRAFLSYHKDRYIDQSVLLKDKGKTIGVLPAAQSLSDPTIVVTHPGATYGGVLHQGRLNGSRMVEAFLVLCKHYQSEGFNKLCYKSVPFIYHKCPSQDDLYALFKLGAICSRRDLSCAIFLKSRRTVSNRRKRGKNKALKHGLEIVWDKKFIPEFWGILTENLQTRHSASPVHSLSEIEHLSKRFPDEIVSVFGKYGNAIVAGLLLFNNSEVWHAQYIASSKIGYEISALDLIFDKCITNAKNNNASWFDFGISNENQGLYLNDGLYNFKCEFGGGGVVHEFYEVSLDRLYEIKNVDK